MLIENKPTNHVFHIFFLSYGKTCSATVSAKEIITITIATTLALSTQLCL